jgi:hypothetical protein
MDARNLRTIEKAHPVGVRRSAQGIEGAGPPQVAIGPGTGRNPRKARFFAEQKMRPIVYGYWQILLPHRFIFVFTIYYGYDSIRTSFQIYRFF